jgi:hypothetical protein
VATARIPARKARASSSVHVALVRRLFSFPVEVRNEVLNNVLHDLSREPSDFLGQEIEPTPTSE